jgi:CRP/FNR family transcriptional regulator, cyclic AMP receptor protein
MLIIEKVLLLKNSTIFQNCKETDLMEIASICHEITIGGQTRIFRKNDPGNCVYFIYKGSVSIHDGELQIAVLNENEIFGELSLLDSESRSADATTKTECILLKIEQEDFYDIMATNIDILKGIMKTLCKRLREQDRVNIEMQKKHRLVSEG